MDGGAWWATVHGIAKSRTQLSDFTSLGKEKAFTFNEVRFIIFSFIFCGGWKIKSVPVSTVSPSIYHEVMRPDAMILVF